MISPFLPHAEPRNTLAENPMLLQHKTLHGKKIINYISHFTMRFIVPMMSCTVNEKWLENKVFFLV